MERYEITEKQLERLVDKASQTLVSSVMKRFEMFNDTNTIKADTKELIYENYRALKTAIEQINFAMTFEPKE